MKKALPLGATVFAAAFVLGVALQPINSTLTRGLLLLAILVFVLCLVVVSKGHRILRGGMLVIGVVLFGILALPGRAPDAAALKSRYLAALTKYENAPYVWGGERASGIDCSGLPRKALREALFQEGLRTLNPGLMRQGILQWWFDASAASLASGYRNYVVPTGEKGRIRNSKFSALQPGDVAITATGVHCLVYLQGNRWIEADPGLGKVVTLDAARSDNSWFDSPVKIYRWSIFGSH